jgi:hypothetical protein
MNEMDLLTIAGKHLIDPDLIWSMLLELEELPDDLDEWVTNNF